MRGLHAPASCSPRSGHEVVEVDAGAARRRRAATLFLPFFGPAVALGIAYGELLAGRPPEEDEIEPLTCALCELAREHAVGRATSARWRSCRRWRAAVIAFFADYDVLLTPALAERPLADRRDRRLRRATRWRTSRRSGAFAPYTALFNVTGQPAIRVPVGFGEPTGCRPASSSSAKPLGEDTLLQVAAQIETARPWAPGARAAGARPSRRASTVGHPRAGATPSASASAVPRGVLIVTAISSASSQVASAAGPVSAS